ncbi:hypothetical protein BZG36_03727 [Bifiguratus adelaidae]|uniref:HMG box domain-containing protein n=1 Tax=Bifiguratus adelaidae TaxID=1938954 RepID=A0A261XZF2_9FUNG|nr:hypothetical protein BZG36_03727 [Bifiguratus adelaidae]
MAKKEKMQTDQVSDILSKRDMLLNAFKEVSVALRSAAELCDQFTKDLNGTSAEHEETPGKRRKREPRDPNRPKRPMQSYLYFSNAKRPEIRAQHPEADQKEIVTLLGAAWRAASEAEKAQFEAMAQKDKERFVREMEAFGKGQGEEAKKTDATTASTAAPPDDITPGDEEESEEVDMEEEEPAPKKPKKEETKKAEKKHRNKENIPAGDKKEHKEHKEKEKQKQDKPKEKKEKHKDKEKKQKKQKA